jgi:hypothetical protein
MIDTTKKLQRDPADASRWLVPPGVVVPGVKGSTRNYDLWEAAAACDIIVSARPHGWKL